MGLAGKTVPAPVWEGADPLDRLLTAALPELIRKMTGIHLERTGYPCRAGIPNATVYTLVDGEFPMILALCMSCTLMEQAACSFTGESCTECEVMECALEFFNVFCGHVVAQIYGWLGCSTMMYPPRIVPGKRFPGEREEKSGTITFTGGNAGEVELWWCNPANGLPTEELELFRRREI